MWSSAHLLFYWHGEFSLFFCSCLAYPHSQAAVFSLQYLTLRDLPEDASLLICRAFRQEGLASAMALLWPPWAQCGTDPEATLYYVHSPTDTRELLSVWRTLPPWEDTNRDCVRAHGARLDHSKNNAVTYLSPKTLQSKKDIGLHPSGI